MLHDSITAQYSKQRNLFRRLITTAFSCAGMYWIFIYVARFTEALTEADIVVLRAGQMFPYFILLTIWGIEYMRESRRMQAVIIRANELCVLPKDVTFAQLTTFAPRFATLTQVGGARLTMPLINAAGLALAFYYIVRQYVAFVSMVW